MSRAFSNIQERSKKLGSVMGDLYAAYEADAERTNGIRDDFLTSGAFRNELCAVRDSFYDFGSWRIA